MHASNLARPIGIGLSILSTSAVSVVAVYVTHQEFPLWLAVAGFFVVTLIYKLHWGDLSTGVILTLYATLAIASIIYLKDYQQPSLAYLVILVVVISRRS